MIMAKSPKNFDPHPIKNDYTLPPQGCKQPSPTLPTIRSTMKKIGGFRKIHLTKLPGYPFNFRITASTLSS
jgi:hypothetical protein